MVARKQNWNELISKYLYEHENDKFVWGKNDCCLFTANLLKEISNIDYAVNYRNKYRSKKEAYILLKKNGFNNIRDMLIDKFGDPINGLEARSSDIVIVSTDNKKSLGMCIGNSIVSQGNNRIVFVSIVQSIEAWRIF